MKVHNQIAMILLAAVAFAAMGCKSESTPRSTLELAMETRNATEKLISPEGTSLEITKYLVNGRGPDDETFSVVSNKQNVSISGLRVGSWHVSVDGLNASDSRMASGSATIQLQPEPTPQTIYLDTLEGSGATRITVQWDRNLIADPFLTLDLVKQGESTPVRQKLDTSTLSSGYVVWSSTSLEAGSYMLCGQLYAGSVQISGFIEALRIVDGLTAEATVSLDLEKTTSIPATINLVNTIGEPVSCTIKGITEKMDVSTEVVASIEPEPGNEVSLSWYQDGVKMASGKTYSFTPSLGNHRLDVVAEGSGKASLGSASFSYEGTLSGKQGIPVYMGKVVDAQKQLKAPAHSQLAFLPDGNLLVAGGGTIQICKLIRGQAVVLQSYNSSNAATWPLSQISDVAVDQDKSLVFIADNAGKMLWVFSYDMEQKKLSLVRKSDNQSYASSTGAYPIKETGRLKVDPAKGLVSMSLVDDENRIVSLCYREEPENDKSFRLSPPLVFTTSSISTPDGETFVPSFWKTAISDDGKYFVALDRNNLLVWTNSIDTDSQPFSPNPLPIKVLCQTASYRNVKVHDLAILGSTSVLAASEMGIYLLSGDLSSRSKDAIDKWKIKDPKAYDKIMLTDGTKPTVKGTTSLFLYEKWGICYGLCEESANIIAMSKGDDGTLLFLGVTSLEGFVPGEIAISPDEKMMIVSSPSESGLVLLQLP